MGQHPFGVCLLLPLKNGGQLGLIFCTAQQGHPRLISTDRSHHKMTNVFTFLFLMSEEAPKTLIIAASKQPPQPLSKASGGRCGNGGTDWGFPATQQTEQRLSPASIRAGLSPAKAWMPWANLCSSASAVHAIPPASLDQATWWGFVGDTPQAISKVCNKNYRLHKWVLHKA